MADYFTSDHLKLLNKWKGQKRDDSNPEQNRAYEDLQKAYAVTEEWANELQRRLFTMGRVEIRKRPTNQGNNFAHYNWAKIYPSSDAPKELAYTVGIDAEAGFVVKIDTVGLAEDSSTRRAYLTLRAGMDNTSRIVAILPAGEGLSKTLPELVEWSIEAIRAFGLRYNEVVSQLNLGVILSDEDLLKHFDGKPAFKIFRAGWSQNDRSVFCRLARAVHAAGLDWWHIGEGIQVRFGRKNPSSEHAVGVLGIVQGARSRRITWTRPVGTVAKASRVPLTETFAAQVEAALTSERESLNDWLVLETARPGLWPDQLRDDPVEPGEDPDDDEPAKSDTVRQPVNRIFYGPPGTGKTYELLKLLKREYVQAVTSVSTDEWRNQFIAEKIAVLTWWQVAAAALYELGGEAKVSDLTEHAFIKALIAANGPNRNVHQTLWQSLNSHTVEGSTTVKLKKHSLPGVFDKTAGSVWQLVGDWREACKDVVDLVEELKAGQQGAGAVQRYSFVTFHQSYGYEEFVEGLRPVLDNDAEPGSIQYVIQSGVFKNLCRRARSVPDQRFAMVIDEINRGNISKIFGELITLIEPDKREGAENVVSVTLPYSGEIFSVPSNVDIIGTMNTEDRSLALLDTALRRRFEFLAVMPDARDDSGAPLHGLRVKSGAQVIDIPRMLSAMNERIEALYDRDHCIGHAYFTSLGNVADGDERLVALQQIFSNRVLPLLEEYFFEDLQKIRLILADNQKPEAARFLVELREQDEDLARLFGNDHGIDSYSTKRRYVMQASAFSNPDAYIGIYETMSA